MKQAPSDLTPVPPAIVSRLQLVCLDLPEAYEEQAWTGTRWLVRKKTFAHVLMVQQGWPPAYARVAGTKGPACLLTFRSAGAALKAPRFDRPPFFRPGWWPDIVGMTLDQGSDWFEVGGLVTRSYRALAPKKLADLVDLPED